MELSGQPQAPAV